MAEIAVSNPPNTAYGPFHPAWFDPSPPGPLSHFLANRIAESSDGHGSAGNPPVDNGGVSTPMAGCDIGPHRPPGPSYIFEAAAANDKAGSAVVSLCYTVSPAPADAPALQGNPHDPCESMCQDYQLGPTPPSGRPYRTRRRKRRALHGHMACSLR